MSFLAHSSCLLAFLPSCGHASLIGSSKFDCWEALQRGLCFAPLHCREENSLCFGSEKKTTHKEKSLCASLPGKERKKGTHVNFFGAILGVKMGSQMGHFRPRAKKHIKQTKFSRDCPGILALFMCFFSPIRNDPTKKHINKILAPTQSRDNPANMFMFMCFFFP